MTEAYPSIEPYETGYLDVGEGHRIYWETCGIPSGKPAVVFHGGPGSGCSAGNRRPFDPSRYRIILFDQRGCGRSTPHASSSTVDLTTNTTEHLLDDIERLRVHLEVEQWLVFGGSWGSTLALAYAQRNPHRVSELILAGVTTTSRQEVEWITEGIGQHFPEALDKLIAGVANRRSGERLVDAYNERLLSPDPQVHSKAASDWCDWEMAIIATAPGHTPHPRYEDPKFRLAFARLVTHYFRHHAWLEEGALMKGMGKIGHIPGVMIHGRLDLECPLITPWRLAKVWKGCELIVVSGAGHDGRDPGMTETLVAAADRFAMTATRV